jgi:hypothetical protein
MTGKLRIEMGTRAMGLALSRYDRGIAWRDWGKPREYRSGWPTTFRDSNQKPPSLKV